MTESQVQIAEQFCRYDRTNPNARLIDAIGHEDSLVNHLRDQADEIAAVEDDRIYKTCAYNEDVRPCETVVTAKQIRVRVLEGPLEEMREWTHLPKNSPEWKDGGCGYISYYRDHYFYMWGTEALKRLLKERQPLEEQLVTLRRDIEFMEQRAEAGDLVLPPGEYNTVVTLETGLRRHGWKPVRPISVPKVNWKTHGF